MNQGLPRVVLDTVVFVQALISGRGPAARCLEGARRGRFILLQADGTLAELREVPFRPKLRAKYPFVTDQAVEAFVAEIESVAVRVPTPPPVLKLPRDPKDQPFIDLAVAGDARFIVTWNDRHLTYLMPRDTPEGTEFTARFPEIRIVSPPEFLAELDTLEHSSASGRQAKT